MKTKRFLTIFLIIFAALALLLTPLVWIVTPGLRTPLVVPSPDYWPTDGWQSRTPEELGFNSNDLAEALLSLQENESGIDSLLIIHDGYVVLDADFAPYDGTFPHDMASVTKSVMATLIAIAAGQGYLDLDQPVVSFFQDRTIANLDERKQRMTVRHLLSMRSGMKSLCIDGDEAELQAMRANTDWVQAALDRPMAAEPGTEFCYDSPGFHILSAILQEATGMTPLDFARQDLFEPLGIHAASWEVDLQGLSRGWGDLHLLPVDAARLGFLYLHRGEWNGQQIIPESWVLEAVHPYSTFVEPYFGYGYGWWVSLEGYEASGRGGQYIGVVASRNTLIVTTGSNLDYAEISSWLNPILIRLKDSLPANPQGQAALTAVLEAIQHEDFVSAPTPEIARVVSGRTYICENNVAAIQSLRFNFDDPAQVDLDLNLGGVNMSIPIRMGGKYSLSPEGSTFRGWWEDTRAFHFTVFDVGVISRQVMFVGNDLEITIPEAGLTIKCQTQNP